MNRPSQWWCVTAVAEPLTSFPLHISSLRMEGENRSGLFFSVLIVPFQSLKADVPPVNILFQPGE